MAKFTLYHTDGCHLCELADELLVAAKVNYVAHDIMDDEQLISAYQTSIPVVKKENGETLYWPFDELQLAKFIADN
ncbi:glutaredoxin family protein [Pseudoalteromonas sp. PAB 2.2]|uniref:glutaredoxin family protein n=1 Tax=Pseudoalteromonas sp. PAB 2.2 TaxID=1841508 RepID=UPI00094F5A36|nr:glutaredoxin family protein [Pseudoalteromonas sp. PAB 2.2]